MTDPRSLRSDLALGIDVGTSGVRTAVLDRDGDLVAESQAFMSDFGSDHRDPLVIA